MEPRKLLGPKQWANMSHSKKVKYKHMAIKHNIIAFKMSYDITGFSPAKPV